MSRYFKQYEDKYNPFLSKQKPVVVKAHINIENKDLRINVFDIKQIDAITRKVAKDLSFKYKCIAFSSFNEINLIIEDPSVLVQNNKLETHNVVSLFSQEIFMRYNTPHINHKVKFVSVNTFNIFEDKVKSYICNRQAVCFNNYVTTLASKLFTYSQIKNNSNDELLRILENIKPSLKSIKSYIRNGALNVNGRESNISNMHDKTFRENKLELINNPKITVKSLADINKDDFIIDDDL